MPAVDRLDLGERLESLEDVRDYIEAMDLTGVRGKLTSSEHGGLGWSAEKAEYAEANYRRWIFLRRTFEDDVMPPSRQIDDVWHLHILDTRAYRRDVGRIFGYYLDHNPYFGIGGPEAMARLRAAGETTARRYRELFECDYEDWEGP